MPATPYDLNAILDTPLAVEQAASFLETASKLIDAWLAAAPPSSALRPELEKYVAAHLSAVRTLRPGVISERTMDHAVNLKDPRSGGREVLASLGNTSYGQAAIALDASGILAEAGKPRPAFTVL